MFSCMLSDVHRMVVRADLNCWFAPTCEMYNVWVIRFSGPLCFQLMEGGLAHWTRDSW